MITGFILAGGKSSRMGKDKGLILLNGKPMIQYIIDTLQPLVSKLIIISNNPAYYKFDLEVLPDLIKDKGPIGGLYTALSATKTEKNICVSCDMPFITSNIIKTLQKDSLLFDIVIPKYDHKLQPLLGIYSKSLLPYFKDSISKNELKLRDLIYKLNHTIIEIDMTKFDSSNFYNVNTLMDLKKVNNED